MYLIKFVAIVAFLVLYQPSVTAQQFNQSSNIFDQNNRPAAYAGVYFSLKFGERTKGRTRSNLKYGFTAGLKRQSFDLLGTAQYDSHQNLYSLFPYNDVPLTKEIRIFDTAFNDEGFSYLSLANIPVYKRNKYGELEFIKFGFDEDGKDGVSPGTIVLWILGGAAVLVLVGAIAFAASDPFEGLFDFNDDE